MDRHGYKYISISWAGTSKSGKTNLYSVTNNHSGDELGRIKWHAPWRQYVFVPHGDTIYSVGCMTDISDFVDSLMKEHFTDDELFDTRDYWNQGS